jgi:hypothetical protein
MGFLGGVSATQIDATTLQIVGRGNGYTDPATIQSYVLLKAAQETLARGYDTFVIVSAQDASRNSTVVIPGQTTSYTTGTVTGTGNAAFGTATTQTSTSPATIENIFKPGETLLVKMLKGPKPADAPPNMYSASEIVQYLGPKLLPKPKAG